MYVVANTNSAHKINTKIYIYLSHIRGVTAVEKPQNKANNKNNALRYPMMLVEVQEVC